MQAQDQIAELTETRSRLEAWHKSFTACASAPLYWHVAPENSVNGDLELLWYRDLGTANAFVYSWSFQVICLTHIQSLMERFPCAETMTHMASGGAKRLRDACIELCVRIYQSMEYVLQKRFMLYGISSAQFPVQTACEALRMDAKGRAILGSLDPTIIVRSETWTV